MNYAAALPSAPSRTPVLGICDFNFNLSTADFIFYLQLETMSQVGFGSRLISNLGSLIQNLRLRYLTVDSLFTSPFSQSYFSSSSNPPVVGPFSLSYYINFTGSAGVSLDLTHGNSMLAFLHIYDIYSPSRCYNYDI